MNNQIPDLIQHLQNNDTAAIEQLYRDVYPNIANFIINNDGTPHDARRCFRKAMTIVFRQTVENQLNPNTNIQQYIYALARAVWLSELNRRGKSPIDANIGIPVNELPNIPESLFQSSVLPDPPSAEMMSALDAMHPEHKKFLMAYYFYKVPIEQLAEQMDYSESFARVKKRRCLDELRRLMEGGTADATD